MSNIIRSRSARLTASIAVVTTATLLLAGCGRSADEATATAGAAIDDSPATGTVTLWAPDGDATVIEDVIAPFEEANPDLDVEVTLIPSDEYTTKLQAAIAAGTTPDIAQLYTEAQAQFLDPAIFEAVPDGVATSTDFFPGAWDAGVVDGTAYSVPWYTFTRTLVYRKDFAETGGATAPKTQDDMVPFLKGLEAGGAEKGLGTDVGWDGYNGQSIALYTWQNGGEILSADGSEWTFDTPEVVEAIEYNASFFSEDVASPDGPMFLDSIPYFVDGKTGAMVTGPWALNQITSATDDDWLTDHVATAPLPEGSANNAGTVGGGSWGVLSDSENSDAAWKVIRYLSNPETQVEQYKAFGSLPAVQSAWDDPSISDQPLLDAFFDQLQNTRSFPQSTTWTQVSTQIGSEFEAVVRGGESPEDAAANIQSFAENLGTGTK
ncbi:multiple sugar transport system substrate-binding protein [Microbacterium halimionae]|uniref:Multiple sugar transport system substrate-binding protein n=1 Tax=Microbacterium halimionae TaxID=1526413 RepID=A0A7W3JMT1_9MICO|nr:extracellular solute-binding protein [Microbacterium halimionae]MBA8815707.1 multiple sugar transport system substrate-binding protein [Microbacterium halimionae]NII95753.1 multiple sugar transport system substrate-binding protein [Microbacterium halimionae]